MKNEFYYTNQNSSIHQLGYQFEFDIQIISIKIDYKSQFNFKILIKRGNKQNEIDRIFKYNQYLDNEIPINEEFSIVSVLNPLENSNFDFNNNCVFHDKIYKIYICIYTKTGFKPAISGELNLSNFINDDNVNTLVLSNKTFNEVVIKFKINCKYISEYGPLNVNSKYEDEIQESAVISKIALNSNNEDHEKTKTEGLLEKKYINTLSTNRSNSIFSNLLGEDNHLIGKNRNINEDNTKNQISIFTNDIKDSDYIQIINSSISDTNKFDLINSYTTNSSNMIEGMINIFLF